MGWSYFIDFPTCRVTFFVKVEIIVIPLDEVSGGVEGEKPRGWPPGFFEETAGCFADDPIQRAPQGDYEQRRGLA